MSISLVSRSTAGLAAVLLLTVAMLLSAPMAMGAPGYQPDSTRPSIDLTAEVPVGVAIDQTSQVIYVAEISRNISSVQPGLVEQLSSSGTPTASSPFETGGEDLFVAVAVDQATHGIYAYQAEGSTPFGPKGTPLISAFSSSGSLGSSFAPANVPTEAIAVDSSGRIFFPNSTAHNVQIFSPSGTLEGSVTCGGCPAAFSTPQAVAFDSAGKLYVVDSANGGRVLKFSPSGGSYAYDSTLQSGKGAVAVAVDSSSNDVFVGDLTGGTYHVVAYDASAVEFDDFGAGAATSPPQLEVFSGQLAVNSTTHDLYLTDPVGGDLRVFERISSIPAPTATIAAPSPVGQVEATLKATVNPKGHVLTTCRFEYTDHADFLANGYSHAEYAACPGLLGSPESTNVSASVTGLDPATSYDYRISVENHGGSVESGSQSFQTLPALPPEVTTGTASSLTKTTATLGGAVNPKGGAISNCHLEWVTDAGFQSNGFTGAASKACSSTPSGNAAIPVSTKASGLIPGTSYRFRVVATNNAGTTQASPAGFATPAETCAENVALCPLPETPPPPVVPPVTSPTSSPPPQPRRLKCRKGFKKKRVRGKLKCVRVKKRHR